MPKLMACKCFSAPIVARERRVDTNQIMPKNKAKLYLEAMQGWRKENIYKRPSWMTLNESIYVIE